MEDLQLQIEQLRRSRAARPEPPRRTARTDRNRPGRRNAPNGKREGFFGILTLQAILAILLVLFYMAGEAIFPAQAADFRQGILETAAREFRLDDLTAAVNGWLGSISAPIGQSEAASSVPSAAEEPGLSVTAADAGVSASLLFPLNQAFTVTSRFGARINPVTGSREVHQGVDLAAPADTPVRAAADGRVAESGFDQGLGNFVRIDHADGISTLYGHCSRLQVKTGIRVRAGEIIGFTGSTGVSTGVHLHFAVLQNGKALDPARLFPALREVN